MPAQVNGPKLPDALEAIDSVLRAFATRFVLSAAIVMSLLIIRPGAWLQYTLLALFALECVLRGVMLGWNIRHKSVTRREAVVFTIVLLATVSFIPIEGPGARILLLGRIARLLLLITYWGPLARDFAAIALQRERMSQIMLVMGLAVFLTALGASTLRIIGNTSTDFNGDGSISSADQGLFELIWWSWRQVMDPGNLVQQTGSVGVLLISLVLTVGGLLIVAVLIGMGASLVEELVRVSRTRKLGLSQHTVVLNVARHSLGVLENITSYFTKQVRWRRVALQGPWEDRPAWLDPGIFRSFHYRAGRPADTASLALLDIASARRVAILASGPDAEADADAVTAVLSARVLNEDAWIVVELNKPGNIPAALKAGQRHCVPVPARRLAALVLTQELVDHGRAKLIQDFVSLEGQEIYTALFGDGRLAHLDTHLMLDRPFTVLRKQVLEQYDCMLLGYFVDAKDHETPWLRDIAPVLNPSAQANHPRIRGLIAVAPRFRELRRAVDSIFAGELNAEPGEVPAGRLPIELEPLAQLGNVIVLGFHDDTVEMVGEILRTAPETEVTIVGEDEADRERMRACFLAERTETGAHFAVAAKKKMHVVDPDGRVCGTINIRVADRYADGLFRIGDQTGPVGNVFDYDALILLAERDRECDSDGATTLGVLKLLDEWKRESGYPLRRVVAEVVDEQKAELLEKRTAQLALSEPFSFVCTQLMRRNILSHSFFVPGLPPVMHNLMTAGEEEIFAFRPTTRQGEVLVATLVSRFGAQSPPLIPLAIKTSDGRLAVNPRPAASFAWADIESIYVLGTASAALD